MGQVGVPSEVAMPNTVKFMDKMIAEYKKGIRSDKNVCQSIRNVTRVNERQWSYDYQRVAEKMAAYSTKQTEESCEDKTIQQEEANMKQRVLDTLKDLYGEREYKKMLKTPGKYAPRIREDIAQGRLGKELQEYFRGE